MWANACMMYMSGVSRHVLHIYVKATHSSEKLTIFTIAKVAIRQFLRFAWGMFFILVRCVCPFKYSLDLYKQILSKHRFMG